MTSLLDMQQNWIAKVYYRDHRGVQLLIHYSYSVCDSEIHNTDLCIDLPDRESLDYALIVKA